MLRIIDTYNEICKVNSYALTINTIKFAFITDLSQDVITKSWNSIIQGADGYYDSDESLKSDFIRAMTKLKPKVFAILKLEEDK